MTDKDFCRIQRKSLTVKQALEIAFTAGESYGMASHKDFIQIHYDRDKVVAVLLSRLTEAENEQR